MLKGRPPKARPKPLATYEQNRDMYGFMVRPQHLEQYREYATIYKEEEAERSDRWEQFLTRINESVPPTPAIDLTFSEENLKRADSSDLEESSVATSRYTEADNGAAKLWGQLRKSLWAIESAASIKGRGLKNSSRLKEPVGNRISSSGDLAVSGYDSQSPKRHGESIGISGDGAIHSEASPVRSMREGSGDESEDEFCDATESTDVLREGDSPPKITSIDSPWEEELRFLVRGGVPMALRGELWQVFVGTKKRRAHGHYNALLTLLADVGGNGDGSGGVLDGSNRATSNFLSSKAGVHEKWTSQIEKDLPRTFPGHPALDEDGRNTLRRLLTAYARHNPSVGYCQAMNFLAALLLLLMPEENAFWTLTGIIDDYFEGYYSEKMVEAQVDQLVFEDLVREQFPKLVSHLDMLGVQVAWVSGPWFLSIFVNVLPWESVLRVWDVLLYEGNRCMLFRTGLALMEMHAPALTATRDAGDAVALLQSMASATFDSSQLVLMASMGFQMVTEARLEEFRLRHRPEVLVTLQERSIELDLWRNSNSSITQKLPYLYNLETSGGDHLLTKMPVVQSKEIVKIKSNILAEKHQFDDETIVPESPVTFEKRLLVSPIESNINTGLRDNLQGGDLQEQVAWLKIELARALDQKKAAVRRAEELETALMEMVKEDNRRLLSAKVEKLEAEVRSLNQLLVDKKEQEQALMHVLMRMEQEQKISDDARRYAELDSTAQRRAAEVFQEKYEGAADALVEMEKRMVMAETMLEATLSYQALGNSPVGSGSFRRLTDASLPRTPDPSILRSHQNGIHGLNSEDPDDKASKQGTFNSSFGLNWRDRSKARSGSVNPLPETTVRTFSNPPPTTIVETFSVQARDMQSTLEGLRAVNLNGENLKSGSATGKKEGSSDRWSFMDVSG